MNNQSEAAQHLTFLISVLSVLATILLACNAYFIKGLLDSLNQVRIQTAILIERSGSSDEKIKDLEANQKEIFKRINELEKNKNCRPIHERNQ